MDTSNIDTKPTQFPEFWNEEWLKNAIDELDNRKMTYDERTSFEFLIERKAQDVHAEKRRIEAVKIETISKALAPVRRSVPRRDVA